MKKTGKVVSRSADIGDSVVVSSKIEDGAVVSGDIAADTIALAHELEYHTTTSVANTTSGIILSHNLGQTPNQVTLTLISTANLGNLHYCGENASQIQIGSDVSGVACRVVVRV